MKIFIKLIIAIEATSSRRALMLQTRTVAATRRLVVTTLSTPLNLQSKRRKLASLFASATRTLQACDGLAHTEPSLTGLMPSS
eukprot:4018053-Pleurochrysis_carterae.AAC.1